MQIETKNKIFFTATGILRTMSLQCASGPLIQTLLSVLGYSTKHIYIFSTILQAASVLTIVLFSRFADNGNIFSKAGTTLALNGVTFLFFLPFCLTKGASLTVFIMFIGISVVQSITLGLETVCEYKIPYYIIRPEHYGTLSSIIGIVSSVITFIMGAVISAASKIIAYEKIMIVAFFVSGIMVIISAICTFKLKNISGKPTETKQENKLSLIEIFKEPVFLRLIPANFFRGIGMGILVIMPAIALDLGFDETVTSAMVSVQSVAILVSCGIFGWLSRTIFPGKLAFWGSLLYLPLPFLLIKNPMLFLVIYAIVFFGRNLIDHSVPNMLIYIVPAEIAGPYNAWRLVITNGSTLIGTSVAALLPIPVLLIATVIIQLASGIMYLYAKKICKIED